MPQLGFFDSWQISESLKDSAIRTRSNPIPCLPSCLNKIWSSRTHCPRAF